MIRLRIESILWAPTVALYLLCSPAAWAEQSEATPGFANCVAIKDDRARLDCIKKLIASSPPADPPAEAGQDRWPLVVTPPPPGGGHESVSIMRTADTTRSDSDLAGLMIRCQEKPGFEVLLALVRPLPPRAQREVVVNATTTPAVIHAGSSCPLSPQCLRPDNGAISKSFLS
jgi:hypothetical protein